jgi:hypothetical protein
MNAVDRKEQKELLNKCWMTHDAMWFAHCLSEIGIEKTNKINRAAVRSMALIEAKRVTKALGIRKIDTFEDFKKFYEGAMELVMPDFMDFKCTFPEHNLVHLEWGNCFAYNGVKQIGVIDQYQCGIFTRIDGWLDSLAIEYSVTPHVEGCMMYTDGKCFRDYKLALQ